MGESSSIGRATEPLRRLLGPFLASLAVLTAARFLLLLLYSGEFGGVSTGEVLLSFLLGLRFDVSITCAVLGLPLLLSAFPYDFACGPGWRKRVGIFLWLAFTLLLFLASADLVYFGYVQRHLGPELGIAHHDLDQTVELVLKQYPHALGLFILLAVAAFFWIRRLAKKPRGDRPEGWRRHVVTAVLALLLFIGARGNLLGNRLELEDAFDGVSPQAAVLAMNGPFSSIHHFVKTGRIKTDFYPEEEALETTKALLFGGEVEEVSGEFPLLRRRSNGSDRPNVVVVMLEGWSGASVDSLRQADGAEPIGLTPRFDELTGEGVLFTRFFATGQRTRNGVCGVLGGFPSIPGLPYIGKGLERMGLPWLGRIALAEGYGTTFIQGARRSSQQLESISALAGFNTFLPAEDIPGEDSEGGAFDSVKALDHHVFEEANRRFDGATEPFLAYVHTACTHAPMKYPEEFEIDDSGTHEGSYRNALRYADDSLGAFFDRARDEPWYGRTVFIVVSDHVQRRLQASEDPTDLFRIPCLVITPGLEAGKDDRVGSQTDVIATIAHLAGWATPYASLGRSLFDDTGRETRGALCSTSDILYRIESDGWVAHTLERRVDGGAFREGADLDAIEKRMLSTVQTGATLLLTNRLGE